MIQALFILYLRKWFPIWPVYFSTAGGGGGTAHSLEAYDGFGCFWNEKTLLWNTETMAEPRIQWAWILEFGFWTRCMKCGWKCNSNRSNNNNNNNNNKNKNKNNNNNKNKNKNSDDNNNNNNDDNSNIVSSNNNKHKNPTPIGMTVLAPDSSFLLKVKQMWSWYLRRCLRYVIGSPEWHHGAMVPWAALHMLLCKVNVFFGNLKQNSFTGHNVIDIIIVDIFYHLECLEW